MSPPPVPHPAGVETVPGEAEGGERGHQRVTCSFLLRTTSSPPPDGNTRTLLSLPRWSLSGVSRSIRDLTQVARASVCVRVCNCALFSPCLSLHLKGIQLQSQTCTACVALNQNSCSYETVCCMTTSVCARARVGACVCRRSQLLLQQHHSSIPPVCIFA